MTRRFLLAGLGVLALAGALLVRAAQPDGPPAKGDDQSARVKDKLSLEEQILASRFQEFELKLLKLKQRLERSSRQEDRERAVILGKALEKARESSVGTRFDQLVDYIKSKRLSGIADIQEAQRQSEQLADDLRAILALLREDSRAAQRRDEMKRLEQLKKEIDRLIREQRTLRARTQIGRSDQRDLKNSQAQVANDTNKVADQMGKHGGKGGEAKNNKGDSKDGGKGTAAKGRGKDGGKSGEQRAGQGKDAGSKGGEAKQAEAKGGQGKAGEPKTGQAKGGEGKQGQAKSGEPKAGQAGAKSGAQGKQGQAKSGPQQKGAQAGASKSGGEQKSGAQGSKSGAQAQSKSGAQGSKGGQAQAKGGSKSGSQSQAQQSQSKSGGQQSQQAQAKGGSQSSGQGQSKSGQPQDQQAKADNSPQAQQPPTELSKAQKRVREAYESERKAEDKIAEKKNPEATQDQDTAIKKLEEARKKLEELLRQMREEELERLLADLQARCERMLRMQIRVYEGTLVVHKAIEGNPEKKASRQNEQDSLKLSDDEKAIVTEASKAIQILEDEGSAVAFPEVFVQVREDMRNVQRRLGVVDTGKITQTTEEDIISTLRDMIKALEKAKQDLAKSKGGKGGAGQQDQKLLDQIAELKMIRAMQIRVNSRTQLYGRQYQGEQAADVNLRRELHQLSERQERIFEVTNRIVREDNR